ncbi:uncharacterized protein LOC108601008 isoform X3 [Drosophila busckii]|uniref:uncharacterized protein LOC108601008 isoform X3 n=1 Tax=Drosophila busckii TaxID=30019 RepID=UPI00083F31A6|nr:uncharacterized protein LOC108601008 isoform X3 [Drosophila busckii]
MVYSIKNSETGEFEYFYADTTSVKQPEYDEETGEPVNGQMKVRYRKHGNFHIPKHFLRGTICDEVDQVLANKFQVIDIKATHVVGKAAFDEDLNKPAKATPGYEREDFMDMDGVSNAMSATIPTCSSSYPRSSAGTSWCMRCWRCWSVYCT